MSHPVAICKVPAENAVCFRRALLVLGMHRSGTSALTRVLGLSGAALPLQHLANSHESNPLGHWEPQRIVDAHDRFLEECGTRWDSALGYPTSIFTSKQAESCRRRLIDIVHNEYADAPLFVLKDPRTSRLMALWRPVFDELQATPYAIVMVRNPLEVASSLRRRDGWDEYRALTVWLRYMISAERETRDLARCFIKYDDLVNDWRSAIATISERLDIALLTRTEAAECEIDRFVRQDLKHHQRPAAELLYRGDIADCVKEAYHCFCLAAETGIVDHQTLDDIAKSLDNAERLFKRMRQPATKRSLRTISVGKAAPDQRDALLALVLAEFGRASDVAEHSERVLRQVLKSRSWRFTKLFRALGRSIARIFPAPVRLSDRS